MADDNSLEWTDDAARFAILVIKEMLALSAMVRTRRLSLNPLPS